MVFSAVNMSPVDEKAMSETGLEKELEMGGMVISNMPGPVNRPALSKPTDHIWLLPVWRLLSWPHML